MAFWERLKLEWHWLTDPEHPVRRLVLIAGALLVLPWLAALPLALLHYLDTGTVGILVSVSFGLPSLWAALAGLWLALAGHNAKEHHPAQPQWGYSTPPDQQTSPLYRPMRRPAKVAPRARLVVVVVLSVGLVSYVVYVIANAGSPASPHGPTAGSSATSGSHGRSSHSSGYTLKYRDISFTLNGGGCQNGDISIPAWVTFTGSGPHVSTSGSFQVLPGTSNGDLELECELGDGNANPGITFSGDQAAEVTGTPGSDACELAITRDPLSGGIQFDTLSRGMQFCIDSASGLLARVTLVRVNYTADDLAWTVTAWSPPA